MSPAKPYDPIKRLIDVFLATVGLVLTAPVQLLVAGVVRQKLGRPIFFRQPRPGRDEQVFELVKFRTMLEPDVARGLISDDHRLTSVGSFLRSTSLDELPTLWNVLRGDMSLVGPRPLLVSYVDRYNQCQRRRHEVRPGVTGLAQVSGRNTLSWENKFELDVVYVDRRSLRLDASIVIATVMKVLSREGISDGTTSTAAEFLGSSDPRG